MGVIFSENVMLTPEMAKELLSTVKNNRLISKSTVNVYAMEMKAGKWFDNGIPIIMSGHVLIDGQHRCAAVIQSGVTIPVEIKHVSTEDANGYDLNRIRSVADVMRLTGEQDAAFRDNKIIGAVNFLLKRALETQKPPKNEVVRALKMIDSAVRYTYKSIGHTKRIGKSPVHAAIITAYENGYPIEKLDSFTLSLKTGFMYNEYDKTVIRLRDILIKTTDGSSSTQNELYGITLNALYNYQRCKVMARIPSAPDKFPLPKKIIEIKDELGV